MRVLLFASVALVFAASGLYVGFVWFSPQSALFVRAQSVLPKLPHPREATILFGGDMMFDRSVRTASRVYGEDFLFSCLDSLFKNADLVVANLEGPITDNPSKSVDTMPGAEGNYTFTFPTTTATLLRRHNVRVVSLGNNHILNFGQNGALSTMLYLEAAHVDSFGDPLLSSTAEREIDGIRFSFISYNQFIPVFANASTTLSQIREARSAGNIPVVYAHWGEEYAPATAAQKELAHAFVDAGAELVVGAHPHVVQEHEKYRGKYIYYSLGNLIFDQYWDGAVRTGLLLKARFTADGVERVQEQKVHLERDRRTCPIL